MAPKTQTPRELLQQHVDTWRDAGEALAAIERAELAAADTREAVRQIFGHNTLVQDAPQRTTSGLVEQQFWFAKLAAKLAE